MTDIPEDLFQQVYNRAPTDQDRNRLIATKAHLGLSSRDELWPFILTLDHYSQIHFRARAQLVKEVNAEIGRFEKIMAQSCHLADAKARQAVENMIDKSATRIAEAAIQKATIPSALLAKQKHTSGRLIGGVLALICIMIGATLMYLWMFTQGICEDSKRNLNDDLRITCVVQRHPFSA